MKDDLPSHRSAEELDQIRDGRSVSDERTVLCEVVMPVWLAKDRGLV